jgi:hypothetical protein
MAKADRTVYLCKVCHSVGRQTQFTFHVLPFIH